MPTLHHSCRHTQLHTGSATNPGSADVFCGSTHVPASVPITFFLHSHMKLSCSIWPVCALPSSGLALPGLMATWSWFRSPQWSPINAEPRLNTNLSGWPLDLQGDSTWWINTAVVSTMQLILYLIPPFHGSLLPWINTPKAPSLVSRACLRLQVQAGSQAPTAWASRSFLNPGIYQGKKCPGKAGNRALLSNSAVCLMEKRESITWRNTNKIPWENKEYFIYSGFRQPLSFCLQCSLKHFSFHTKSSYLSAVFTLVSADAAKIVRSRVLSSAFTQARKAPTLQQGRDWNSKSMHQERTRLHFLWRTFPSVSGKDTLCSTAATPGVESQGAKARARAPKPMLHWK